MACGHMKHRRTRSVLVFVLLRYIDALLDRQYHVAHLILSNIREKRYHLTTQGWLHRRTQELICVHEDLPTHYVIYVAAQHVLLYYIPAFRLVIEVFRKNFLSHQHLDCITLQILLRRYRANYGQLVVNGPIQLSDGRNLALIRNDVDQV